MTGPMALHNQSGVDDDMRMSARNRKSRRWVGPALGAALIGAAVLTELQKPREERTWEGRIGGRIPYDLRMPTLHRARQRLWNPRDRRILVPTVFGVGWTVNFGRLAEPWVAEIG